MDFGILPPEVSSGRMYAGPGPGSMLTAATAWDGLADELYSAATEYGSVITAVISGQWLGPASVSMAAAAASHVAWLMSTAAQAEQAGAQANAAAAAHATAFAMTVPPAVIAANRALLAMLAATNFLGQNAPAIAFTEAHYGEMWAQNAAAMYGYAASSASASALTPFAPQRLTTNPGGLAGQVAAVGRVAGTSAGQIQAIMSGGRLMSAAPHALQALASPLTSTSAATGLEGAASTIATLISDIAPAAAQIVSWGADGGIIGSVWGSGGMGVGASQAASAAAAVPAALPAVPAALASAPEAIGAPAVSAGMGQAAMVGALSAPQSWATAAPAMRLVAATSPAVSFSAAPADGLFGEMPLLGGAPLMSMGGRAAAGDRHRRAHGKGDANEQPGRQVSLHPTHWRI